MGFAQLKSLLLPGVMVEKVLQDQFFFSFSWQLLLFSTSQPEDVSDRSLLTIAGGIPCLLKEREHKHTTSQASLCVEGMVCTTRVPAEWQLAHGERVTTLRPRPGHRDRQRRRRPAADFCPAEPLLGAALPFAHLPTACCSADPSAPPSTVPFLLGKRVFCP